MVNPVGNVVSRLIRQRSYAGGELIRLEKKLEQATANLRVAQTEHRVVKKEIQATLKRVAELDSEIAAQSAINVADIYPRKATPKRLTRRWGRHLAEIIELFRGTEDSTLNTMDIVGHMARLYELPQTTKEERRFARRWVTAKLQYLVRRGAMERLHDPSDNVVGLWRWIGI